MNIDKAAFDQVKAATGCNNDVAVGNLIECNGDAEEAILEIKLDQYLTKISDFFWNLMMNMGGRYL